MFLKPLSNTYQISFFFLRGRSPLGPQDSSHWPIDYKFSLKNIPLIEIIPTSPPNIFKILKRSTKFSFNIFLNISPSSSVHPPLRLVDPLWFQVAQAVIFDE